MDLNFSLHEKQAEIFGDPARFKVVVAGRQSGKSHLLRVALIVEALKARNERGVELTPDHEVLYVAPTFAQAHNVFWGPLKRMAEPVTERVLENTGMLYLTNGRRIRLVGMDNPDNARGATASYVGLDEYADMPERTWDEIIQPMLIIPKGGAMFIGTPKGKNHFYKLYKDACEDESGDWAGFTFTSAANPYLGDSEYRRLTKHMSEERLRQEIEASFTAAEGQAFKREWFKFSPDEPQDGSWCIAVDLAGFKPVSGTNKRDIKRLDNTAIAIVKVHSEGWWVKEIRYGQWDTRETAFQILKAAKDVQSSTVGIEKGALANAVAPYLDDYMRQYGRFLHVIPLTHGNQRKADRIQWALQGRAEKGRIILNPSGDWCHKLIDEALDFPDPRAHDDLLDALAYVDQLQVSAHLEGYDPHDDQFIPADPYAGY